MTDEKQNGLATSKSEAIKKDKKESSLGSDTETSAATDPQEEMEGPISSIMQDIKKAGEASDVVSKKEADEKKDSNT